jgi:hypothetical protein
MAASSAGCSIRTTPQATVWADTAYRSAANVALLARRGLVPQFQRPKPRGKSMPPHLARGNATWARVRVAIEHVFAAQKCWLGLIVRSVGLAQATARLELANLVTDNDPPRLVRHQSSTGLRSRRLQGRPGAIVAHRSSTDHRRGSTLTEIVHSRSPHNPFFRGVRLPKVFKWLVRQRGGRGRYLVQRHQAHLEED